MANSNKIKVGQLENECMKVLNEYRKVSFDSIKKATDKTAKETVNAIKGKAPRRTGAYAGDWTHKKTNETASTYGRTVYNRKHYQLAHLLEKGHEIKGYLARRTTKTRTRAFPHIPSDDETEKLYEKNLTEEIEKQ